MDGDLVLKTTTITIAGEDFVIDRIVELLDGTRKLDLKINYENNRADLFYALTAEVHSTEDDPEIEGWHISVGQDGHRHRMPAKTAHLHRSSMNCTCGPKPVDDNNVVQHQRFNEVNPDDYDKVVGDDGLRHWFEKGYVPTAKGIASSSYGHTKTQDCICKPRSGGFPIWIHKVLEL